MIKPEWTFMNDNKATAWECVCGALNAMSRDKCGKCGKIKKVKKYYQYGNSFIYIWNMFDSGIQYAKFANL